jgi:uncharacterized protein YhbP (UPF0306 family)
MDIRSLIEEYLQNAKLMQVATSKDGQPWACSVYFAFDPSLHLYWISKSTRRHSQEIKNNEKVAGTIVLPHTPGDKVRGIQFEGIAKELTTKNEIQNGMKYYAARFGMKPERVQTIVDNTDGHVCYTIIPTSYVLFDEVNFPEDSRKVYTL